MMKKNKRPIDREKNLFYEELRKSNKNYANIDFHDSLNFGNSILVDTSKQCLTIALTMLPIILFFTERQLDENIENSYRFLSTGLIAFSLSALSSIIFMISESRFYIKWAKYYYKILGKFGVPIDLDEEDPKNKIEEMYKDAKKINQPKLHSSNFFFYIQIILLAIGFSSITYSYFQLI